MNGILDQVWEIKEYCNSTIDSTFAHSEAKRVAEAILEILKSPLNEEK